MGKYHRQENQYIHRPKRKVWHLLHRTNIQTAKPNPLPKDRTPGRPAISGRLPLPPVLGAEATSDAQPLFWLTGPCPVWEKATVRSGEREKKRFPLERCLKVLATTFQTLRLVIKGVNFIGAFSARGCNVTSPAPKTRRDRPQSAPELP